MKGDFTRDTFERVRHFSRVLMQQGRVQLDADFNEQISILLHYLRAAIKDIIGPYAAAGDGFQIFQNAKKELVLRQGHYYVDGLLCESERDLGLDQKELEESEGQELQNGTCLYLDVWERHVTCVQDDRIREVALGGPDTCTRAQVVWRVRMGQPENSVEGFIRELPPLSTARMRAQVRPEAGDNDDNCVLPPESRYRGTENQLYRIEIHRGTNDQGGKVPASATFKWSRDNGSTVFPIVRQAGAVVTLQNLGRDARTSLRAGDWVEIIDDDKELRGVPGIMAQVDVVESIDMEVTLKQGDDASGASWPGYDEKSINHPLLRKWDHRAKEGISLSVGAIPITESGDPKSGWIEIEDGIEVQFVRPPLNRASVYRTGDYWLIPARAATGKIEWPEGGEAEKDGLLPHGVEHHYAPLALIDAGSPKDERVVIEVHNP